VTVPAQLPPTHEPVYDSTPVGLMVTDEPSPITSFIVPAEAGMAIAANATANVIVAKILFVFIQIAPLFRPDKFREILLKKLRQPQPRAGKQEDGAFQYSKQRVRSLP
jgi:hypothetical protein